MSIAIVGLIEYSSGRLDNPLGFGALSQVVALLAMIAISAYTASVMTTTIADVMVIYATLPFVAAAIGFLINGERVSARTLAASGSALRHRDHGGERPRLGASLGAGAVDADDPRFRRDDRAPAAPAGRVDDRGQLPRRARLRRLRPRQFAASADQPHDFAILFAFGLTTIGLAFVIFMEGAEFIPSAEAGLISLLDVVLGPLWVFIAFGENPGLATTLGGAIVLAAAMWRMAPELRREQVS